MKNEKELESLKDGKKKAECEWMDKRREERGERRGEGKRMERLREEKREGEEREKHEKEKDKGGIGKERVT